MIFFYTMVYYVVSLIRDEKGFNISNRLSATTTTAAYLLFISIDTTDCSRCFRIFNFGFAFVGMGSALFLASFVWSDSECCAALCNDLCRELIIPLCIFLLSVSLRMQSF